MLVDGRDYLRLCMRADFPYLLTLREAVSKHTCPSEAPLPPSMPCCFG